MQDPGNHGDAKVRRMEARINEATQRWNEERKTFQAENERWREKLFEQCNLLFAANQTMTRQRDTLRRYEYTLTIIRSMLQQPISIEQRHDMLQLIEASLQNK